MPSIKFDTTVETAKVVSGFRDIQNAVHQTAERVEKDGKSIDDVISNIQNGMNIAIGGWSIGKFANQMMQVRGQFQQTEMAFRTMLQSEEKANALMKQMIRTAAITPFGVEDVTEGAKQLLAFNVAAEDVNKTLIGLGDVAAGMGLNLKDLVMLYGTTIAKGKMDTMDLYQFLNRGIPIADEIAKVMGLDVTNAIKEVQKQIKAGKVTSDIFIQAMQSMTAEGSKFGGLMEAQSKTITGQISNIEDAIEQMFNELGKSQEGVINTGLDVTSKLVENWKEIGGVVVDVVTAYGIYKGSVIALNAAMSINLAITEAVRYQQALAAMQGVTLGSGQAAAAAGVSMLTASFEKLKIAIASNPIGLMAVVIAAATFSMYKFYSSLDDTGGKAEEVRKRIGDLREATDSNNKSIKKYLSIAQDATKKTNERKKAISELKSIYPGYFKNLNLETANQYRVADAIAASNREYRKQLVLIAKLAKQKYLEAKQLYDSNQNGAIIAGAYGPANNIISASEKKNVESLRKAWEEANNAIKEYDKETNGINQKNNKKKQDKKDEKNKKDKSSGDKRKQAQEDLNKELEELEIQNQDNLISLMQEGTEKRLAEIKNDYAKRKAEIDKQEAEFKKKNKEAGKKASLTSAQSDALSKARDLATQEYNKKLDEVNREALTSMRDYLKEYGSLYQQKQAIAEEYEEKIAKAQTEGEKKTLQQEKKKALVNFDYESISMGIDWKGLMSGVGNMSQEMLKPMLEKLDAYTKTDRFQQADTQTQQKVVDLMQEIRDYVGTDQNTTWQTLASSIADFNQSILDYKTAVKNEETRNAELANAEKDLKNGKITNDAFEEIKKSADSASDEVVKARDKMNTFGVTLNATTDAVKNYTSGLTSALNKLGTWKDNEGFSNVQSAIGNIDTLKGALDQSLSTMADGTAKNVGNSISKTLGNTLGSLGGSITDLLGKGMGSVVGIVAQIPKLILNLAASIKDFVTGILNSFTELLRFEWLSDLVVSITDAIGNLIDAIFDLPENLFKAIEGIVVDGVGGLLNSVVGRIGNVLSLGALSSAGPSAWFENSNAKRVAETIDKLTDRNELLQQSIEDLTDAMENSYGSKVVAFYQQAYKNQQETNKNYLEIAKAQAGYHGSHHSWNSYWSGFSKDEMDWIKKNVKADFNGDLFSLSPEEMKLLRGNVAIWERIENTGKGGYGENLTNKLNDYIDQAGKLEELSDKLKESLTQISFDSMKDSFISDLMDMSKSAQDFVDDFAEMMQRALLSYSMEDLINGDLKKLYDDWAKAIQDSNGNLSQADIDAFNKRYDEIVQKGLDKRDQWAKITGYTGSSSSSQTATSGGWASMGQDDARGLNGRFTALQIAGETISQNVATNVAQMETIVNLGISINGAVLEIRNMMIMTNSHLEDIVKYAKLTYNDFGNKLDDVINRLKNI